RTLKRQAPPLTRGSRRSMLRPMQSTSPGGVMQTKRNIAARAGRWSAQHRKIAIFGWLAFVLVAFAIGGASGTKTIPVSKSGTGESGRANRVLSDSYRVNKEERVLVQSRSGSTKDAEFAAGV